MDKEYFSESFVVSGTKLFNQYIIFCKVFNEQTKHHGMTRKAITETIRICKDRNVLREILMLKKEKISIDEIPAFFPELSDEEIEEVKGVVMQLA